MGPEYGYGPVNYSNPQGGAGPFSGFDNRISYNEMVKQQMVSQYQQSVVSPQNMTMANQRMIASDPRFSYGVHGGQDPRYYQRQASQSRVAFGASLARGMSDVASFGIADAAARGLGMGAMSGMAVAGAAAMIPMHFVNKGVNNALQRRQFMSQISADVDQYRDQIGFNNGISYNESSQLGSSMQRSMYTPGGFFSKDQQMKIHKTGLANNLLSAKSRGADSGTMKQYEKNFEELKETTEDVVKLLQTTIEGGMSVIKELQQKGFGSMKAIKQQVIQAKALGGMTGLGSQNMMQVGAAGAQAVQGTPWASGVGAGMYQVGAAQASSMAAGSAQGAYAVQRAGGVAQAGATLANATMNMMSSGIGSKMAAYAMNADGSVNQKRLDSLLGGNVSANQIITGANQTGYAMGGSRVRFGMFKEDMMNEIGKDPTKLGMMMRSGFSAWSSQRPYDKLEDKAWAFAGQYTQDSRGQRLLSESLLSNPGYARMGAAAAVEEGMMNYRPAGRRYTGTSKLLRDMGRSFTSGVNALGEGIVEAGSGITGLASGAGSAAGEFFGAVGKGIGSSLGFNTDAGDYSRAKYGSMRDAYNNMFGVGGRSTSAGRAALASMSPGQIEKYTIRGKISGFNANKFLGETSVEDLNMVTSRLTRAIRSGGDVSQDDRLMGMFDPGVQAQLISGKSGMLGVLDMLSGTVNKSKEQFDSSVSALSEARKGLSASDLKESVKRIEEGSIKMTAGNWQQKSMKFYEEQLSVAKSNGSSVGILRAQENIALNAQSIMQKSTKMNSLIPTEMNIMTDVAGAEKDFMKAVKPKSASVSMYVYSPYGGGGMRQVATPDATIKGLRGVAKSIGIDTSEKGWESSAVMKINQVRDDSVSGKASEEDAKVADTDAFRALYNSQGFKNASDAYDTKVGVKELALQRGMMRSGMMRLSGNVSVSKKFQNHAMNLFEDVGDWGDFKSANKKALMGMSGMLSEQLSKASKSDFMTYMTSEGRIGTTADKYDAQLAELRKQSYALIRKSEGSKDSLIIHDGEGKEKVVGTDISVKEAQAITDDAKADLERKMRGEGHNENSRGTSMTAPVGPPVLNYWNNRWAL